jgi:hypothetical protein
LVDEESGELSIQFVVGQVQGAVGATTAEDIPATGGEGGEEGREVGKRVWVRGM